MLVTTSPHAETPPLNWSDLGVSVLRRPRLGVSTWAPCRPRTLRDALAAVRADSKLARLTQRERLGRITEGDRTLRSGSSHRAPCRPTSSTSTPNSASPPACNSPKKQPETPDH